LWDWPASWCLRIGGVGPSSPIRSSYAGEARRQHAGRARRAAAETSAAWKSYLDKGNSGLGTQVETGPARHMSFCIEAPTHTVGALRLFGDKGGIVCERRASRRVNYGNGHGMLIKPLEPCTSALLALVWQLSTIRETTGWDRAIQHPWVDVRLESGMVTAAATITSSCGHQSFWPARDCRRAVAVQRRALGDQAGDMSRKERLSD